MDKCSGKKCKFETLPRQIPVTEPTGTCGKFALSTAAQDVARSLGQVVLPVQWATSLRPETQNANMLLCSNYNGLQSSPF